MAIRFHTADLPVLYSEDFHQEDETGQAKITNRADFSDFDVTATYVSDTSNDTVQNTSAHPTSEMTEVPSGLNPLPFCACSCARPPIHIFVS